MEESTPVLINTYQPFDAQIAFHTNSARFKLYGGSMGGGKSRTIGEESFSLCRKYPGIRGLLVRKVLADFKITTYLTLVDFVLKDALAQGLVKDSKQDQCFIFWNGSKLYYGGLDQRAEGAEKSKYFSGEFAFIGVDEAREISEKEFNDLSTRIGRFRLPNGDEPPYYMFLASNPAQNWLKIKFILNPSKNYKFFPALPSDNPHNPIEYVEQLKETFKNDIKSLKAYVYGSWDSIGDIDDLLTMGDIEPCLEKNACQDGKMSEKELAKIRRTMPRVTSCDPAGMGDDKTSIHSFIGPKHVSHIEQYGKKEYMETVGRLQHLALKNFSSLIAVDMIGEGREVYTRLREICDSSRQIFNVHGVDFRSTQGVDQEAFLNKRAEVYWYARTMIKEQNVIIPDDDALHAQLCAIKYKFVGGGKRGLRIKIEDKDEIKKRLGFSPDKADSYVIGLYSLQYAEIPQGDILFKDSYLQRGNGATTHMAS
jgi:hypothetical protein